MVSACLGSFVEREKTAQELYGRTVNHLRSDQLGNQDAFFPFSLRDALFVLTPLFCAGGCSLRQAPEVGPKRIGTTWPAHHRPASMTLIASSPPSDSWLRSCPRRPHRTGWWIRAWRWAPGYVLCAPLFFTTLDLFRSHHPVSSWRDRPMQALPCVKELVKLPRFQESFSDYVDALFLFDKHLAIGSPTTRGESHGSLLTFLQVLRVFRTCPRTCPSGKAENSLTPSCRSTMTTLDTCPVVGVDSLHRLLCGPGVDRLVMAKLCLWTTAASDAPIELPLGTSLRHLELELAQRHDVTITSATLQVLGLSGQPGRVRVGCPELRKLSLSGALQLTVEAPCDQLRCLQIGPWEGGFGFGCRPWVSSLSSSVSCPPLPPPLLRPT
ncbi:hypothetical protein PAPYR_1142 [Paratrimastix pyriformis]|uniref:Uncharacterized protein n=1 Tax=Paratrimastix pyriformis TaxID=342808 RepID=A0ABQ8UTN5_9EUKA|nr:hypothetical protein PAPYR_1142 [Paratrimastix pyriformis]